MKRCHIFWLLLHGGAALAQVGLPVPVLPRVIEQLPLPPLRDGLAPLQGAVPAATSSMRARARSLLARYPERVERDPRGAPMVRSVIVAMAPADSAVERARAAGFQLLTDAVLAPWNERLVTLLAPRGMSTQRALRALREADPGGSYDFDHLFVESAAAAAPALSAVMAAPAPGAAAPLGMIDSGVDIHHPVFQGHAPEVLGCEGRVLPSEHGTAVASLLVGRDPAGFSGAAAGAALTAVDVYCGASEPGGRVRDIATALALLAQRPVRVINLSFVGPANVVLERAVRRVQEAGIVIVAAAGNDGPQARPLFPAAYPGVIAVTAVDARNNVLLEACRGEHIAFAAPGADMLAAALGGGFKAVRGTSYAAPLVAGLLARELVVAGGGGNAEALRLLQSAALDRGKRGRDRSYGMGVVAGDLRVPQAPLAARPAGN
ncbi:MAG: S8 family serine peptidase [Steroidobacteraceae bacterium]